MPVNSDTTTVVELLKHLVACPSVNPGPIPPPSIEYGERAMTELLTPLLKAWGATTQLVELAPDRFNLVATWPGKDSRHSLLLDAHADTVGITGMTIPPFEPRIRGGRLYGRGACDTKGPMAAMLLAIRKILNEDGQLPVTVHFAATGDEEDGALGAIQLVESGLRVDGVIVGEPTDLKIVYAHKGACRFRIVLTGKAAHSSIPSLGINAVEAAAELVVMIRNQFPTRLQYRTHSELGPATLCISTINGGNKVNIVPDRCQIEIDCRCLPGEHRAHLEGEMKGLLELLAKSYPGLGTECQIFQWYPAMDGRTADAFVARMTEACGTVTGSRLTETVPCATNGGFFSQATMPCVVFGPGSIANAHTADESVDLAQVEQAVNIYASMIRAFATR